MNIYQKKLNKLTKEQINKNIEEKFPVQNISFYDVLAPSFCTGRLQRKIIKAIEYDMMSSKGYYRWIRKCKRRELKDVNGIGL